MNVAVVVPNWNGQEFLEACLGSLLLQTQSCSVIVVDNGSSDGSMQLLEKFPSITVLRQSHNLGFAGGVNVGIKYALENNARFVLLFNNDAVADKCWAQKLVETALLNKKVGIISPKILHIDRKHIDSTGDCYSTHGLPFPRGRGELDSGQYDQENIIFTASGGASLFRSSMLSEVGLFDDDFFAYYEDVDLGFRAQLLGWRALYEPNAVAYHHISATSSKLKGFSAYQVSKNFPLLFLKNMPFRLLVKYLPVVTYRYWRMLIAQSLRGNFLACSKGLTRSMLLMPKKLLERHHIQAKRRVSTSYIDTLLFHGQPPIKGKS